MSVGRTRAANYGPPALGLGTLVFGVLALELLIRLGAINRYVVPRPSQIIASFERVVFEPSTKKEISPCTHGSRRRAGINKMQTALHSVFSIASMRRSQRRLSRFISQRLSARVRPIGI